MVAVEILSSFFVQLAFTVGLVILYGGFISLCNRCFYDACGNSAFGIVKVTGYIGTPVHELSHALMCLVFGHKVQKIRMFGGDKDVKTLGYVEHTYYRKNMYHQLGNFFIGISPVLAGGAVILLLVRLLIPHVYGSLQAEAVHLGELFFSGAERTGIAILDSLVSMLGSVFSFDNFLRWQWWLCILLSFSVAIHMEVSRSDIVSGLRGLCVIAVALLLTDGILGWLFPNALAAMTSAFVSAGIFAALLMAIPAVFSLMIGLFSVTVILARHIRVSVKNDRREPAVNHHTVPATKKRSSPKKKK